MTIKQLFIIAIGIFLLGLGAMAWWYFAYISVDVEDNYAVPDAEEFQTEAQRTRHALDVLVGSGTAGGPWTAERELETHNTLDALLGSRSVNNSAQGAATASGTQTESLSTPEAARDSAFFMLTGEELQIQVDLLERLAQ